MSMLACCSHVKRSRGHPASCGGWLAFLDDRALIHQESMSRIALIRMGEGLVALNTVKELMADRGRPHDNLYEVALWADMLRVQGDELFYAYMVDNQAIVIPESIDAIRALTGTVPDGAQSMAMTNAALGIEATLLPASVGEPVHR
jgi:glyceraldehyde-3-phosphate dehydrogenase (NAD(P)+) (phosphorylating)